MAKAIPAGVVYVLAVFAIGFVLGTIRVMLVIPRLGEITAVLLELPVLLACAWWVCRRLVAAFPVPATMPARLVMGEIAFVLLMLAELGLAVLLFGRTPAQHFASFAEPAKLLGLAGQLAFAAFPVLQLRR